MWHWIEYLLYINTPQTGSLQVVPMRASWSYGTLLIGTSWLTSTSCGRNHSLPRRLKYDWVLRKPARCPSSICPPMEGWGRHEGRAWWDLVNVTCSMLNACVLCSSSSQLWAAACTCTVFWPKQWWPTGRLPMTRMSYTLCCSLTGTVFIFSLSYTVSCTVKPLRPDMKNKLH